jgi:hypothetical protein
VLEEAAESTGHRLPLLRGRCIGVAGLRYLSRTSFLPVVIETMAIGPSERATAPADPAKVVSEDIGRLEAREYQASGKHPHNLSRIGSCNLSRYLTEVRGVKRLRWPANYSLRNAGHANPVVPVPLAPRLATLTWTRPFSALYPTAYNEGRKSHGCSHI